jgi:hypothetical protein
LASLPRAPSAATSAVVTVSTSNDGPRHVGRIVDPSVGGQGDPEPEIQVSAGPDEAEAPSGAKSETSDPTPEKEISVHPVRAKLLERARAARGEREATPQSAARGLDELDNHARPTSKRHLELDQVGTGSTPPSSPPLTRPTGPLSTILVAGFGTLIGLFRVASLIALGMNLDTTAALSDDAPAKEEAPKAETKVEPKRPVGAVEKRKRK